MNFSKILKTLRKEKHLTQGQLASYLNTSRSTIAGYETKSRQPDFETLQRLADYFEVSIDFLITGENSIASQKAAINSANCSCVNSAFFRISRMRNATSHFGFVSSHFLIRYLHKLYTFLL